MIRREEGRKKLRIHIVQKGDTLWKIAKEYGISFEDLKRLNVHLANPDYIVPGMEIILPEKINKEPHRDSHKEMPKKETQVHKEAPKESPRKEVQRPMPPPPPIVPPQPAPHPPMHIMPQMPAVPHCSSCHQPIYHQMWWPMPMQPQVEHYTMPQQPMSYDMPDHKVGGMEDFLESTSPFFHTQDQQKPQMDMMPDMNMGGQSCGCGTQPMMMPDMNMGQSCGCGTQPMMMPNWQMDLVIARHHHVRHIVHHHAHQQQVLGCHRIISQAG